MATIKSATFANLITPEVNTVVFKILMSNLFNLNLILMVQTVGMGPENSLEIRKCVCVCKCG